MQDPLASWAAIAGAVVTLIIAVLTFFNIRIARSSLRLMEEKEKRSYPNLHMSYIDSYSKADSSNNIQIYIVNIGISNRSDTNNSIRDLSLRIDFRRDDVVPSNIFIPAVKDLDQATKDIIGEVAENTIIIPRTISSRDTVSGWAIFKIGNEVLAGSRIEQYTVILTDSNGVESFFEIKIMRKVD